MASEAIIQTYSSLREKRKRIIHSEDATFPPQDKIIRKFPESSRLEKTEADKILQEWMNLPVWSIGKAISDVEDLKIKHERNSRLVLEHDDSLTYLLKENIEIKKEIQELKSQLKANKKSEGIETVTKEIDDFRSLFGLPPLSDDFEKVSFGDLEGILNDLSEKELDSVEVIRSIRG